MKQITLFLCFLPLLVFPSVGFSQSFNWTLYQTHNSVLPHDNCHFVAAGSGQLLWIGTSGGLARRTLASWDTLSLPHSGTFPNWVSCIAKDQQQVLWVGTYLDGISSFDGQQWTLHQSGQIRDAHVDQHGTKWFATTTGLKEYNDSTWVSHDLNSGWFPSPMVNTVTQAPDGTMWIGTDPHSNLAGGMAWYDGQRWFSQTTQDGLPSNFVNDILFDQAGRLWVATDAGIGVRDQGQWTYYDQAQSHLPHNRVHALALDSIHQIWAGTEGGASCFSDTGWVHYTKSNSPLPDNRVRSVAVDSSGHIWLATGRGVVEMATPPNQTTAFDPLKESETIWKPPFPNPLPPGENLYLGITLLHAQSIKCSLYQIQGQRLIAFPPRRLPAGKHELSYALPSLSPGAYVWVSQVGAYTDRTLVLVR